MYTPVKTCLHKTKKLFANKGFLFLINGFLLASLFYFYSEDKYEKQLFEGIAASISKGLPASNPAREDSILHRSLDLSYRLLRRRMGIFGNTEFKGINGEMLHPVSFDLMTGKGACGSNAYVLGRILQEFNMYVRFPQMKVDDEYGGHILIEAKASDGWKLMDPLYNLVFKRPDGKMASFEDVRANWSYYQQQVPKQYDVAYNYQDARYTNWNKVPVVAPLLRQVLYLVLGKETTDHLSLRSFMLKKYNLAFNITLLFYVSLCVYMLKAFARKKKQTLILKEEEHKISVQQQPSLAAVYN